MDSQKNKHFNEGFFFGLSQVLQNGGEFDPVVDAMKNAGVTKEEIEKSEIEDFDKEPLLLAAKYLEPGNQVKVKKILTMETAD